MTNLKNNTNKCCSTNNTDTNCTVDIEQCDIFHFMANVAGLTVLHPGGFKATDELAKTCKIGKNTQVLDIACGKGTSAYYFAKKFDCQIMGIDIDEKLVNQAKELAEKKGMGDKLTFKVANAEKLPFSDNEFDVTIFQAALVLIENMEQAVAEAIRVTKPGGRIGVLELTWRKEPPKESLEEAKTEICAYCIPRAKTCEGLKRLLFTNLLLEKEARTYKMGSTHMIREEGISNVFKVMLKWLFNSSIRNRMNKVDNFFKKNDEHLGYGIYVGQKSG